MEYEDKLSIETPEGVSMEVPLAGVGSRISAAFLDGLIQVVVILAVAFIAGVAFEGSFSTDPGGSDSEALLIAAAITTVVTFLILFFYFVFFETLWSGRTPGKRALGLRVVQLSGARIGFKASFVRNVLRIVDLLPSVYLVGLIAIVASSRNQRVGDMVAGTLVVREVVGGKKPSQTTWAQPGTVSRPHGSAPPGTESWDVSGISAEEIATVRAFLERRSSIPTDVRRKLAADLETKLRAKVPGAPGWDNYPEVFLELLAATKGSRG